VRFQLLLLHLSWAMEAEVKGQGLLWPISPICIPTPSPCPPISPICTNCRAVEAEVKLMLEAALAVAP